MFAKHHLTPCIDHVAEAIHEEATLVYKATLSIHSLPLRIPQQNWPTAWIHLYISKDSLNVEPSEREDFWELSVLQLIFPEQDLAKSGADVSFFGDDVALVVDHEAGFVHSHVLSPLISAGEELYLSFAVSVKHSHHLLDLEGLA